MRSKGKGSPVKEPPSDLAVTSAPMPFMSQDDKALLAQKEEEIRQLKEHQKKQEAEAAKLRELFERESKARDKQMKVFMN